MKVLTYASTCFLQRTDPDFRQEWSREGRQPRGRLLEHGPLLAGKPRLAGVSACRGSSAILDEYGVDGIYIDGGYVTNAEASQARTSSRPRTRWPRSRRRPSTTGRSPICWP